MLFQCSATLKPSIRLLSSSMAILSTGLAESALPTLLKPDPALELRDVERLADHEAARHGIDQRERMHHPGAELHHAAPQVFADARVPREVREDADDDDTGGNGCAFEVLHLAGVARERFGGHVVAREAAHAAAHEIQEHGHVPSALHARR